MNFWQWFIIAVVLGGWMLVVLIYFFYFVRSVIGNRAPYIGSYRRHLRLMKQQLFLKPGESLIDLGCGDGKALRFFSRYFAIKELVGYDTNILAIIWGKFLTLFSPFRQRIALHYGNMTKQDISHYDYVYMFLFPSHMKQLEARVFDSIKEGAVVIVNTFRFPTREPYQTIHDAQGKPVLFLYRK